MYFSPHVSCLFVPVQRVLGDGAEAELAEVQGRAELVPALALPLHIVQDPPEGVGVAALKPVTNESSVLCLIDQ